MAPGFNRAGLTGHHRNSVLYENKAHAVDYAERFSYVESGFPVAKSALVTPGCTRRYARIPRQRGTRYRQFQRIFPQHVSNPDLS